jgi:hypothetical protein
MSKFDNPTALAVGATGKLCGLNYRVLGRVVLGVDIEGETCYWNEFNLRDDSGQSATLVFEEGDNGPEWKLFILFDPVEPMSATEAARKKVGDTVALNGKPIKVTLAGQSRVYHIEGQVPEGVEIGDIAHYFNADTGVEMEVASWTGDEIEFYRGIDMSVDDVASGFRLPVEQLTGGGLALAGAPSGPSTNTRILPKLIPVIIAAVVAVIAVSGFITSRKSRASAVPRKQRTPPALLSTGATGALDGRVYLVSIHSVVGIARTGSRYDWHEYALSGGSRLINNLTGDATQWHLLHPAKPSTPLTPVAAAALRAGGALTIGDSTLTVHDLFQAPAEGKFGLLAQSGNQWAMLRWTADTVECVLGRALSGNEVLDAFRPR